MQPNEPLISYAEAARRLGKNRSTIKRQADSGEIRCHDGRVYFSEVLEDRASRIDLTRSGRGAGKTDDMSADATTGVVDATDNALVVVDGMSMDYKTARTLKEAYIARLKELEYRHRAGELAEISEVIDQVTGEYAVIRERLLSSPGKMAAQLFGLSMAQIEIRLKAEMIEILTALSDRCEQKLSKRGKKS